MKALVLTFVVLLVASSLEAAQSNGSSVPNTATTTKKVTIVEYADFQCPFCARQAADLRRIQNEFGRQVEVVFKNFPLPFHAHAREAHLAALAAKEQGKFWEMHDLIFSHPEHLLFDDFTRYAAQLGLDQERFAHDRDATSESEALQHDIQDGQALGISGTPTFLIDGHRLTGVQAYGNLKRIVEAEVAGLSWNRTAQPSRVAAIDVKTEDAPVRGDASAPVTVIEYSDFQCPFCAKAAPAMAALMGETNNLRWVFKNFPLSFHADSRLAHMAALAAGEQGKFWEMHDMIFSHQSTIKRADLLRFAADLRLDQERFERDLDNPRLQARINQDHEEGERIGVTGTPTFVVGDQMFSGFSPERLKAAIARQERPVMAEDPHPILNPSLVTLGPPDARLKIDWYMDLGSPLSPSSLVALQRFMAERPGMIQVRFRNFPLATREHSMLLHQFALAAAAQGKFWLTQTLLLADTNPKDRAELTRLAAQAGLDQKKLWAEVDAGKYAPVVAFDLRKAKQVGVAGTPTFVVGEQKLDGIDGLRSLDAKPVSQMSASGPERQVSVGR